MSDEAKLWRLFFVLLATVIIAVTVCITTYYTARDVRQPAPSRVEVTVRTVNGG